MKVSKGYVRKIETMGMLDGPGVRTVVFFSGCPLRCSYCHNPDMWKTQEKDEMTVDELMHKLKRLKPYYGKYGGVTFCGGEALSQPEFLIELLKECKKEGIHTALDTSGFGNEKYYDEILSLVDLILYDLKEVDSERYQKLTSVSMERTEKFLQKAQEYHVPLWIRTVIVPGLNDTEAFMEQLAAKIKTIKNIQKIELLPYHTLGVQKYKDLNMDYPLKDTPAMDKSRIEELQNYLDEQLKK